MTDETTTLGDDPNDDVSHLAQPPLEDGASESSGSDEPDETVDATVEPQNPA